MNDPVIARCQYQVEYGQKQRFNTDIVYDGSVDVAVFIFSFRQQTDLTHDVNDSMHIMYITMLLHKSNA